MEPIIKLFLPCLWSFIACVGFGLVFNIHGFGVLICGFGGALGWLTFLLVQDWVGGDVVPAFFAAVIIAIYSEVMARVRRCPVTGYLQVALLPLVPGAGIYNAMRYCVASQTDLFISTLLHTFGVAAALAIGAMLSSTVLRIVLPHLNAGRRHRHGGKA